MSQHNASILFVGPLTLNPGVNGAAVERFYVEEYLPNVTPLPGYQLTLYKGRSGERAGQYLYVGHYAGAKRLQQLLHSATDGQLATSEEWQAWLAANPVWLDLMIHFDYTQLMSDCTEYVEIS